MAREWSLDTTSCLLVTFFLISKLLMRGGEILEKLVLCLVSRTCKSIVMSISKLVVNENWMGAVLVLESLLHAIHLIVRNFETWPAVPLEACCFPQTTQTSDKPSGRHGEGVAAIIGPLDGNRQPVGQKQQPALDLGREAVGNTGVTGHDVACREADLKAEISVR